MTQGSDIDTRTVQTDPELPPSEAPAVPAAASGHAGESRPPTPAGESGAWPAEDIEEISLLALVNVLLKRWKLVVGLPLAVAFITAIFSLIVQPRYVARTSFVPESEASTLNLPGGLAGLASQFGVSLGAGGASSPNFYAEVLESRTLRDQVLLARFADPRTRELGDSASFLDILEIEGESESERLEKGRAELGGSVEIRVDNATNIVTLSAETETPKLSAAVANLFIDLLNRFNLEVRQSNAQTRRSFIEGRVTEAEAQLNAAEEELKTFLERNRQFQGSPELTFQHDRLQRRVNLKQEVLTTLSRQYEEARIQEVNDTPVITVVDRAVPPDEKSSPKRKLSVIIALVLGGIISVVGAFGGEFLERSREHDREEFDEFTSRWSAIRGELAGAVPRLRRRR